MKRTFKRWFPKLSHSIYKFRLKAKNKKYKYMTLEKTWDDLYSAQILRGEKQLSGEGSYGTLADQYSKVLKKLFADLRVKTVTDIGCGDFNIGSKLCRGVKRYNALDVSAKIIQRNKKKFADMKNVTFLNRNGCVGPIPRADLVTVRQVLQHLTNQEIEAILKNIENSGSKYVLIAEHCYSLEKTRKPNRDMNNHGNHIRVIDHSGVFISLPPFSRSAKVIKKLLIPNATDEYLYLYLWKISRG